MHQPSCNCLSFSGLLKAFHWRRTEAPCQKQAIIQMKRASPLFLPLVVFFCVVLFFLNVLFSFSPPSQAVMAEGEAGRAAPAADVPNRKDFRKLAGQQPLARASMHMGPCTATQPRAFFPIFHNAQGTGWQKSPKNPEQRGARHVPQTQKALGGSSGSKHATNIAWGRAPQGIPCSHGIFVWQTGDESN